jgi:lauroyl/myristoyl acyltransferase
VSLHYSLYSSILVLWLARAATRGLINHLTVFMRSGYIGYGVVAEHRWQQAEQCGLLSREHFALADRTERGPSAAVRTLVAKLRRGDVVLVFPDATFIPRRDKSLELCVGGQTVSLPRGAAWLVREAECPVLPIYVRPDNADRHAIVFGALQDPVAGRDPAAAVQASLQYIVSHALMRDPGPWEGWLREWSTP